MPWTSKDNIDRIISFSLSVLLFFLIFLSLFFFLQLYRLEKLNVILLDKTLWNASLRNYESMLKDAEVGQRGFLLTKDSDYLAPYQTAISTLPKIEKYLIDHCEVKYEEKLEVILKLSGERLKIIADTIKRAEINKGNIALNRDGKIVMDQIRSQLRDLLSEKETEESQIWAKEKETNTILLFISALGFLILSFFILWLMRILRKNQKINTEKEQISFKLNEIDDLYQKSPVGFHSVDCNGYFLKINQTELQWLGYDENELIGKVRLFDLLSSESRKDYLSLFESFKESGSIYNVRFKLLRKDGTFLYVVLSATAVYDLSGSFLRSRAVLVDVTEAVKFENELLLAKSAAEEANQAKSEFLASMSHELRTPLNAVIGLSMILLDENPKPEQVSNLKNLKFSSETLLTLINDILDFNKIEQKKISIEKINFNLFELLSSVTKSFSFKADEKLLIFKLLKADNLPEWIVSDPTRILQILNNLLSNSIKFTHKGFVSLSVKLLYENNSEISIQFIVEDSGIGIPDNKLANVFEKFTQLNVDTTRKYGGTGLGLAISKGLVELMEGTLILSSEENVGTSFVFTLKVTRGENETRHKTLLDEKKLEIIKGKRVLVADDLKLNREIVIRFLDKWGALTLSAENGEEVLETLELNSIDLILMDLHMPVLDGFQTVEIIRKTEGWKQIPIIALTASAQLETQEKIKAVGMNDYISKPFYPQNLLQKIVNQF
ncbi:ATP-binding protein [Leptospira sp. 96542]|nr:ATP-binding protein [Leptospira sp. 96542]